FRRIGPNLYEGPANSRIAFVEDAGWQPHIAQPGVQLQRVPWWLDARWIVPAFVVSMAVVFITLVAWPVAALGRRWRRRRWSENVADRRRFVGVRLVLLLDAVVIVATIVLFVMPFIDPTVFNDPLDPVILVLYGIAWLAVCGAISTLWTVIRFWRNGVG